MHHIKFHWRCALTAGVLAFTSQTAFGQEAIRIGTSTTGSVFYTIAVAVSEMVRKHAGINSTVQPLGGSAANMHGLRANRADFSMANSYTATTAYTGTGPFQGTKIPVRLVMQGQTSYRGMLVNKSAQITSVKDLAGKTVTSNRPPLPELKLVHDALLKTFDIAEDSVRNMRSTSLGEQEAAQKTGTAVAGMYAFGARAAQIAAMLRTGNFEPFYMSVEDRDKVLKNLPELMFGDTLKAGVWPEQTKDWHLFGMNAYFTVRADMSAETVYKVAKALLDNPDEFRNFHAAARSWTRDRVTERFTVPLHEGSIRYLRENNLWTEEHERRQKRLLGGN